MILAIHQPQYIPWLGYFDKIRKSDCFVFLEQSQYKPREFQNRNKIRTDSWMWLTVPVISGLNRICDVKIDNRTDWRRKHLKSLKVWYGKAGFFKDYFPFFEEVYGNNWEKLVDLNIHIIKYLLKVFKIETPLYSDINTDLQGSERIIEICKRFKADTYLSGIGGRYYLEEEKFAKGGIKLEYQDFTHPVYHQRKDPFIPYMSALDLLFEDGYR